MGLGSFLFGSPDKMNQLPTMNPEQNQLLSQLIQQLIGGQSGQGYGQSMDYLQEMLNPSEESFNKFADPYMRQFQQQTLPGIAERFAGAGGANSGALSSSGFGQALGAAGAGLQENLASLKAGLQQGASKDLLSNYQGMTGQALGQKPFGYQYQQGSQGLLPSMLTGYAGKGFPGLGGGLGAIGGGAMKLLKLLGLG